MSLNSLGFLIFVFIGAVFYYTIGKKYQWQILLCMSLLFYYSYASNLCIYLIATILSTYIGARLIETSPYPYKKAILILCLVVNFGMLAAVKYTDLLAPIGISFYTFQITGYLLDIYWGRDKSEKNLFKHVLFIAYFPQIIQGPISKHSLLSRELYGAHDFRYENIERGILMILWGYFKKCVIADTLSVPVTIVYDTKSCSGMAIIIGIICYGMQLYCDFSGGIDVVMGVSELFGISITSNFKQPFFSKSIAEFWRRWHITLGMWMKDYVFFPLSLSKFVIRIGKSSKQRFGKIVGRKIPICICNIVVFILVGIWHGSSANFILYGLYNGLIISIGNLIEPQFKKYYLKVGLDENGIIVSTCKTFVTLVLINIGWIFDRSNSVKQMGGLISRMIVKTEGLWMDNKCLGLAKYQIVYVVFGSILLFFISFAKERGINIYSWIKQQKLAYRLVIWLFLVISIPTMGYFSLDASTVGGFMYANF